MGVLCAFLLCVSFSSYGQDLKDEGNEKKWFIALPLRFTQLQNNNTMLSGVKLGRAIDPRFHASVSVYHSFYLNSFKAEAGLNGFNKQPRLFINCVGMELEYYFISSRKVNSSIQLLLGWGFMKYDLKENNFKSRQINYFAFEPVVNTECEISNKTYIGLGFGYRPIISNKQIPYTSSVSIGEIPVIKLFPNGLNLILTLKGFI